MVKLLSCSPVLWVKDIEESIQYYSDMLNFAVVDFFGSPRYFAALQRDGLKITLLNQPEMEIKANDIATLAFDCDDIEVLYKEFKTRNVVMHLDLGEDEGDKEKFSVKDPNGYVIFFRKNT